MCRETNAISNIMWYDTTTNRLTDYEKWFFDLNGYLVLPQVIEPSEIERMLELGYAWHDLLDDKLPAPLRSYGYSTPEETDAIARSIDNIIYADEQGLALNRHIMRAVLALTGNRPQLIAANFTKNYRRNCDLPFHEGHDGGLRNPANDYQAKNGQVFATFLNAAVTLVDIPDGVGGFVCVPGSHKSNFACPEEVSLYDGGPIVHNVTARAGDCILFTELMRHVTRRRTLKTARRTVFIRYSTSYASWTPGSTPDPQYRHLLSDDVTELMQPDSFAHRKKVVQRLL